MAEKAAGASSRALNAPVEGKVSPDNLLASAAAYMALHGHDTHEGVRVDRDMDKVFRFLKEKENGHLFPGYADEVIMTLLYYHFLKGTLIVQWRDGSVTGVVMWYNCDRNDSWDLVTSWREDDWEGDAVLIGWMAAETTQDMQEMAVKFKKRVPDYRNKLMWWKRTHGEEHRSFSYPGRVIDKMTFTKD